MIDNDKRAIEEMASDIEQSGMLDCPSRCRIVAEELYLKDYRKQSEGEWTKHPLATGVRYCSNCGENRDSKSGNYCPNCGAKMKGGE